MQLKRLYDRGDLDAGRSAAPKVKILRLGERQKFSVGMVLEGVQAGYITLSRGRLVVHSATGDVVFRIARVPGLWCCHCRAPLPDSAQARRHVIESHPGAASPDKNNPAGYEQLNALDCARE